MSKPVGFSNSSAGPPPGDLHARSVTAAISRSGSTGSATRASSERRSRSERKSSRSEYMRPGYSSVTPTPWTQRKLSLCSRRHFIRDLLGHRQRAAAVVAGRQRRGARRDSVDEVGELELQRLLVDDVELAALNRGHRAAARLEPVHLHFPRGVIDRQVRRRLEEPNLADAVPADSAGRQV